VVQQNVDKLRLARQRDFLEEAIIEDDARAILAAGLAAVEPRRAVRQALNGWLRDGELTLDAVDRIFLIGAGKAAPGMALGVLDVLPRPLTHGVLVTKDGHSQPVPGVDVFEAAHPVPDQRALAGAERALALASEAGRDDLVFCVLSGGASALWTLPVAGVSLEDVQAVTGALLGAGATIGELNAVRKHLSRIAGGQLARALDPARLVTLAISDVVGSRPDVIGSGPTVPDSTTYGDALAVVETRRVNPPHAVWEHLRAGADGLVPETPKPDQRDVRPHLYCVVADNLVALRGAEAAARDRGYRTLVITTRLEGEAREVGSFVAGLAVSVLHDGLPFGPPAALLLGGETTVHLRGNGHGGRNQELALAAALALDGVPDVLVASLGTDGTDGPTNAAGGIVSGATLPHGRDLGLHARDFLERNDAYHYLEATGGLLVTGPTGTNVNDVVLVLVRPADAGTNVAATDADPGTKVPDSRDEGESQ